MTLILYTTLGVSDLERSGAFYDAVFAALGYQRSRESSETFLAWGSDYDGGVSFWICRPFDGQAPSAGNGTMVALRAASEAEVIAFHAAALAHGGTCEGPPASVRTTRRASSPPMSAIRTATSSPASSTNTNPKRPERCPISTRRSSPRPISPGGSPAETSPASR